jgi:FkbM family methyltransferase
MISWIKKALSSTWFRPGSEHRVLVGPLRGMWFRFSADTGFAALYSGNERHNQRAYAALVRPGDVVLDAGANWGLHTLYLAHLVGPAGQVLAFEPHPHVVEELRWHVEHNGLSQVRIHAAALGDRSETVSFALGESSKTSHFADVEDRHAAAIFEVPCRTVDEVVAEAGLTSLRLIKVDVEGAESRLLQGAELTLRRLRPALVVELHTPEQDLAVAELLIRHGYRLTGVDGRVIRNLDRSWPDPDGVWGTLLALPEEF